MIKRILMFKELAGHSEATALPVLQTSHGRDPKSEGYVSGCLPELRRDRANKRKSGERFDCPERTE
jgi:hypothetical protein